ncbi:MAG: hypothetical protein ACTSPO_15200 [Candidatus Heimdallarchaeaceae archaeon]
MSEETKKITIRGLTPYNLYYCYACGIIDYIIIKKKNTCRHCKALCIVNIGKLLEKTQSELLKEIKEK